MKKMVVGFLFSPDKKEVVLILKNRPDWQKGLYNGIGGHIESDETAYEAMIREFDEEAGAHIQGWKHFATGHKDTHDAIVYFFKAFDHTYIHVETRTDESISIITISEIKCFPTVYNIEWLLQLALDNQTIMTDFSFILK